MENKKAEIYKLISSLSIAFGVPQTKERIVIYTEELSEFGFDEVAMAIKRAKLECKFFPSLAELIDFVKLPDGSIEEMAVRISNEIIECISKFGPYQINEVKNYLGENFGIVERAGGWWLLCGISNDEISTTKAQIRELAKAYILKSKRESNGRLKLNTTNRNKLEKLDFESSLKIIKTIDT